MDKKSFPSYGALGSPTVVVDPTFSTSEFETLSNNISSNIYIIQNGASSLSNIVRQLQVSNYTDNLCNNVMDIEQRTNATVLTTQQYLQKLLQMTQRGEKKHKLHADRLKSQFQEMFKTYFGIHKKVIEEIRKASLQIKPSETPDWEEADDRTHLLDNEADQKLAQKQMQREMEMDQALMLEREERVRQIESDFLDVNEIFRDLASMVHEQGEVVDTIENNIESVSGNVHQGAEQLSRAAHYQKKYRKKLCFLLLLLLVVAIIIVLIVVLTKKS